MLKLQRKMVHNQKLLYKTLKNKPKELKAVSLLTYKHKQNQQISIKLRLTQLHKKILALKTEKVQQIIIIQHKIINNNYK